MKPRRSIELILFTAEEPTRFGVGCLGSRVMAGTLGQESLSKLKDKDNQTPDEARKQAGFTGSLRDVKLPQGYYSAFVELHIEQGPLLSVTSKVLASSLRLLRQPLCISH